MAGWGISQNASEKEKIKSDIADMLVGLNSTGKIDYNEYSELFDYCMNLMDRMYNLGRLERD
jgi:hypothetical protein